MNNGITSCFRYPGGKSKAKVRAQILDYLPTGTEEYREAFVGGGGIFFGLSPTKVQKRWINDVNRNLIAVYEAFRDRPQAFIDACRAIEPMKAHEPKVSTKTANGKKYNARLGEVFFKFAQDQGMDPALRYYFLNRTVWGGRVNYDPKMTSRLYYSNPTGWNIVAKDGFLESVASHLEGTHITCGDYKQVLQADGNKVWIYLDPPYWVDTEFVKTDKLYEFGFTKEDHIALADACGASKHKLCISYDDNPNIRALYENRKGFFIYEHAWTYCGSSQEKKKIGKELIITNYRRTEQMELEEVYPDICQE